MKTEVMTDRITLRPVHQSELPELTEVDNVAVQRALERVGFLREGVHGATRFGTDVGAMASCTACYAATH